MTPSCEARLKNIEFDTSEARILSIEHISRMLIEWTLKPTNQDIRKLKFHIDRGESPSELVQITSTPIDYDGLYQFVDYTVSLFDIKKIYYYRIRAVEYNAQGVALQEFSSRLFNQDGRLDLTGLYIVEEHLYLYRYVSGAPVLIFKKRFEGEPCPTCWDSVLKKVTKSQCKDCYGTGRRDGYYPAIEGWMGFPSPSEDQANVQPQGVVQPNESRADFTDYPQLRTGDIVYECSNHFYWRIARVIAPEKNRVILLQQLQLVAINRSDVEYKIPLDQEQVSRLVYEYNSRLGESEFG